MKFTPGPWIISRELSELSIGPVKDDADVCVLRSGLIEGREIPWADAFLIAAAPDLYAALDGLASFVLLWESASGTSLSGELLPAARAALKKARGE